MPSIPTYILLERIEESLYHSSIISTKKGNR